MRALALAAVFGWFASPLFCASPATTKPRVTEVRIPAFLASESAAKPAFSALLDGDEAKIKRVLGPGDDLLLLVALDVTGDLALVDPARETLIEEIGKLPANSRVALLRAQDGLRVLLDPTGDREALARTIREMPVSGRAGLLDSLEASLAVGDAVLAKAAVRVALLYITDSDVYNYREDFTNPVINSSDSRDLSRRFPEALVQEKISKIAASVGATQTPLFVVHLNRRADQLNDAYQNGLKQLAEQTAGTADFCRSVGEIGTAVSAAFEAIRGHYSLLLDLPKSASKSINVQIKPAVEAHGLRHRMRVSFRKE